ncbi:Metallo-dependent phosphatase [Sistotremastrum niveocremeum HHB9708]|uniref:Serine/threonine-protein phosphatase n=2 Tax=Sistotremastraceae TaxID=3402574 RepID=A0A164PWM6_9AGAM|nr:Metallo-dependent phosphatase [Sistotremastrum niveocremeum HHB9708]KZT34918.1 Metallo-dependent phosphatase [Sistotremastrum suecicum HHB10207 ss-3]
MSLGNTSQLHSAIQQIHQSQSHRTHHQTRQPQFIGRQTKGVSEPESRKPTDSEFFLPPSHSSSHSPIRLPNTAFLKNHFFHEGRLHEDQALYIIEQATRVLGLEPNLLKVRGSTTVCGDIHGQYYDLMKLFDVGGAIGENQYLFLGDYVDRGSFGIECLLYLYSLKLQYPDHIYLMRGNHECKHLTEFFTFKKECLHKYSEKVYEACIKSFQALPVAAILDDRFFCVHGGISPELNTLADLAHLDRFKEPGNHGLLCDLLWSDPEDHFGDRPSAQGFVHNQTRGCSFNFTYEAACQFLERNRLLSIIRGHEAQDIGYRMYKKTSKSFPSVMTIFSAPNYLDAYGNKAAVLKYVNKNIVLRQFNACPHPYWLPNFMNAFTWSLPFVGSKMADILLAILNICTEEELEESDDSETDEDRLAEIELSDDEILRRREAIRNKVLAVGRMARVFKILREDSENVSELKAEGQEDNWRFRPDPNLGVSGQQIRQSIRGYDDARSFDISNERLPAYEPHPENYADESIPSPSLRLSHTRRGSTDLLLQRIEAEEEDDTDMKRIADILSRPKRHRRPHNALKRHETF